ncbi:hypothetical protein PanWU01x14_102540, partial [Parasponia andersonii]
MARFSGGASQLRRQLVQEGHLISRARVHEEIEGVHPFPPSGRGPVEHAHAVYHSHGHQLVRQLGEERREPEEEGLAARGPLRADGQVTFLEELLDHGGVGGSVAAEADSLDGGDDLGEPRDGVGHGGDGAAEGGGEEDGVEKGPVGADEEDAGDGGGLVDRRGRGALDGDADAECPEGVVDERHGEEGAGGDAKAGEEEAYGDPEDYEKSHERRRLADESAVVENDRLGELVTGH